MTIAEALELRVSRDLVLPASTITSTLVVYGARGMGKTNFGAVLAEELKRIHLPFSVLDPIGVWWGLQHSVSGKGPGIQVLVLGGVHGDIAIEPTAGEIVADLVADEDVDVVIDISRHAAGKMWTQGEKIRFVTAYTNHLFERQGERMRPRHQIFEEAGRFIPQVIPKGAIQIAECIGAIEQFVEVGRNIGLGATLITQRSARMNKSVSELADAMIAFRTVGPLSIEAILDWFGEHIPRERWKELVEQIRKLDVGTAMVVSPGWLQYEGIAHMRARTTFDSSATPGAVPREVTGKAAKPDLARYRELMAATIEKAAADDPRELHKRIAEQRRRIDQLERALEGEIENTQQRLAEAAPERIEVPVLSQAEFDNLATIAGGAAATAADLATLSTTIENSARTLLDASGRILSALTAGDTERPAAEVPRPTDPPAPVPIRLDGPAERPARPPVEPAPNGTELTGPQQRVLDVLATLQHLGLKAADRTQVAAFSGYADPTTRRFREAVTLLERAGMVSYPRGGALALTVVGQTHAHATVPIRSVQDLHQAWYDRLKGPRARILALLIERYPDHLGREQLAALTGYSDPTTRRFRTAVTSLVNLGLAHFPKPGTVAATHLLFPPELLKRAVVGESAVVFPKRKPGPRPRA